MIFDEKVIYLIWVLMTGVNFVFVLYLDKVAPNPSLAEVLARAGVMVSGPMSLLLGPYLYYRYRKR